jgi:hypothetical protein
MVSKADKNMAHAIGNQIASACDSLRNDRELIAEIKDRARQTSEAIYSLAQALGYLPNAASEEDKRRNKAIVHALQSEGADFSGVGEREYTSLDKDAFNQNQWRTYKASKNLPTIVTSTAIVVSLKRA